MISTQNFKFSAACMLSALWLSGCASSAPQSAAATQTVIMHAVNSQGIAERIGTVTLEDSAEGLMLNTHLQHLPPGPHGFHIHETASCQPAEKDGKMGAALGAGSHYNPNHAPHHGTPMNGHLGDLPVLNVSNEGTARVQLIAPRLKAADVKGRALMIHAGGDNYADTPKPLGGGGDRIACGLIK